MMNNMIPERLIVTDLVSTLNRILELQDMISNNERERERLLREVEMGYEKELVFKDDRISVTRHGTEEEGYKIVVKRIHEQKQFIIEKEAPEWVKAAFKSVYPEAPDALMSALLKLDSNEEE